MRTEWTPEQISPASNRTKGRHTMNTETTLASLAGEAYEQFERIDRDSAAEHTLQYVRLKDDAPSWIADAVKEAHGASGTLYLPNDWIYETVREAFGFIHDNGLDELVLRLEFGEEADIHSADLQRWLSEYPGARAAIDEAVSELGNPEPAGDIDKLLQYGQYIARGQILLAVLEAVEDQAEA